MATPSRTPTASHLQNPEDIDRLVIAKLQGAKGGRGYFLANSPKGFYKKFDEMVKRGLLTEEDIDKSSPARIRVGR